MKIQYDKDFEKVMNELQANFGWSNLDELPDSYKDLLNDTIKAVKNCSIPAVVGQSEQLVCEHKYQDNVCDWRGVRKCIICGQMEKAN